MITFIYDQNLCQIVVGDLDLYVDGILVVKLRTFFIHVYRLFSVLILKGIVKISVVGFFPPPSVEFICSHYISYVLYFLFI